MPISVTDLRSNLNDQIANAANAIGRSEQRRKVFRAIYRGKKQIKTVREISQETGLNQIQVLKAGGQLRDFVEKGKASYKKDPSFAQHYRKILALAGNQKKLKNFPTKINPRNKESRVVISFSKKAENARLITIEDIDSFNKIKKQLKQTQEKPKKLLERVLKEGVCSIIGETGKFIDWGGEKNDLFTTKIRIKGRRITTAIAFKGVATKGKLTLDKLGTRADQIPRLFDSTAECYLIVYQGQIDQIVLQQMRIYAIARALTGEKVFYGVIDQDDLDKLIFAYKKHFSNRI